MRYLRTAALALILLAPSAFIVSKEAKRYFAVLGSETFGTRPQGSWFIVTESEAALVSEDRIGRVGFPGSRPRLILREELEVPHGHPLEQRGGVLILGTIIGPSGRVAKARVLRGLETPALRVRLVDCLRRWRFEPAMYRGEPWAVEWNLTLDFWPPGKGVSG